MKTGISIKDMTAEVVRQNNAKADYQLDTRRLEMDAYGSSIAMRMLDDGMVDVVEPLDISRLVHRQIGTHLNIPAPYYDLMQESNPELLVQNVNSWFKRKPAVRSSERWTALPGRF